MATEFIAKGGVKTPHAIISGDTSPAIAFQSTKEDFNIQNRVEGSTRVLDFRVTDSTGARVLYTSSLAGMVASVNGNNVAVLLTQENKVLWSTDSGNTFKVFNTPTGLGSWSDIIYYKGRYFISGSQTVRSTTDLMLWTAPAFPGMTGNHACWKMSVANGILILPFDTNFVFRSTDGLTFTGVQKPNTAQYMHLYDIIHDGAKYVGVGNNLAPNAVYTSTDLVTWGQSGTQPNNAQECMSIAYTSSNKTYWVMARDDTFWSATTLGTWTRVTAVPQSVAKRAVGMAVYSDGSSIIMVGTADGAIYYSFNAGSKWNKIAVSSEPVNRIIALGSKYLVSAGQHLYEYTLSESDPSILQLSYAGVTTNQPQANIPNSLVRKDYVDGKINDDLKFQTERLDASDALLKKSIDDINGTSFDYGEY